MQLWLRWLLISSAIVIGLVAIVAFIIILIKVMKIKRQIKQDKVILANELSKKESEQKLMNRQDFGQPIIELQQELENVIDHEIVEFCINSTIRNDFKKILMIGNVGPYEAISISNKSNAEIDVINGSFNVNSYQKIKNNKSLIEHKINIINDPINQNDVMYDSIMLLDEQDKFVDFFIKYEPLLKQRGMFIISNTKLNKKATKELVVKIEEFNYKYDMLKWHKGFVLIVK